MLKTLKKSLQTLYNKNSFTLEPKDNINKKNRLETYTEYSKKSLYSKTLTKGKANHEGNNSFISRNTKSTLKSSVRKLQIAEFKKTF